VELATAGDAPADSGGASALTAADAVGDEPDGRIWLKCAGSSKRGERSRSRWPADTGC
jgi:hypothetical protein